MDRNTHNEAGTVFNKQRRSNHLQGCRWILLITAEVQGWFGIGEVATRTTTIKSSLPQTTSNGSGFRNHDDYEITKNRKHGNYDRTSFFPNKQQAAGSEITTITKSRSYEFLPNTRKYTVCSQTRKRTAIQWTHLLSIDWKERKFSTIFLLGGHSRNE